MKRGCPTPRRQLRFFNRNASNERLYYKGANKREVFARATTTLPTSSLATRRHGRRETTGWISKCNRVFPGHRVVDLKLGPIAIDGHGSGIAIDCDGDLLAGVACVSEGKLGLQSVGAAAIGLAAHLEGNQVFAWDAAALVHCP